MRKTSLLLAATCASIFASTVAESKTIGIWQDVRSYVTPGLTNSLVEAGWNIEWFRANRTKNDLEDAEKLAKCDVIFCGGGWNAYFFPSAKARLQLTRYVASGKSILLSGFRSGYVRTANRPMFPEIGAVYNRLSGAWVSPVGDSPLAKVFGSEVNAFSGKDHLAIKVGEWGTPFCKSDDDIVGVFGDYYNGRVIVFGCHFAYQIVDETRDLSEKLLFASLDYLTKAKPKMPVREAVQKAEREFIRREALWTYTADDRGPDRRPGLLVALRDKATSEPEALAYKIEYFKSVLAGDKANAKELALCTRHINNLKRMGTNVRNVYAKAVDALSKRLDRSGPAEISIVAIANSSLVDLQDVEKDIKKCVSKSGIDAAKAFIDEIRPKVEAAKRSKLQKEITEDLKKVPELVSKLSSKCAKERLDAALEIGRISPDDKAAVDALIKAIDDTDDRVRSQAVISLGWMQAKPAVESLIKTMTSNDKFLRRRAVQALGYIGDTKAIGALMKVLEGDDKIAKVYAAIALGHLKATEALDKLIELAEVKDKNMQNAAILALGYIGDKKAEGVLKKLFDTTSPRKGPRGPIAGDNYLSNKQGLSLRNATEIALKRLAEGGRPERGVKQPEEYRSKDAFYALTKKFNAFVGRTETVRGSFAGMGQKLLWAHVKNAGFTGVHNAWGWPDSYTPEDFTEIVREAGECGLIWIDVMAGWVYANIATSEATISNFEDAGITAYHGVWAEETWPDLGGNNEEFIQFIEEKYGKDWQKALKLTDEEVAIIRQMPSKWIGFGVASKPKEKGFLPPWDSNIRTLVLEFGGKLLEDGWRESQDQLHARRKGFAQTYVISTADPTKVIGGISAAERLDSFGHESYESFGRFTAYFMERYRNGGAARSVMSEQYNWYCPSIKHALRGFWQNAIHSKCYYNFALHQIFEQPSWYDNWSWERGRWDAAKEVFNRVAKTPDLYAIKPTAANAAVIFSERSSTVVKEQIYFQCSIPVRNDHNVMAAWTALNQSQIPADVVWAETLDSHKISKYKFLYLPTAKYLSDNEIEVIRKWVEEGGILIAEGNTTMYGGLSLKLRKNYALADVFGCNWVDTTFRTGKNADTFATRHGSPLAAYKVIPGLDQPVYIDDTIHRDKKPVKSIILAKMSDALIGEGAEIEMDAALGYDVVKPTTAKAIAYYKGTKDPAILVNEFGKGRCYFVTANFFAHAHVTSRWEMMPGKIDFWKNVREFIAATYNASGIKPAVEVSGVSLEVEVTVDNHGDKYVVHMLDYDIKSDSVTGAKVTIPGERKIKSIYYPNAKTKPLKLEGRSASLRDFSVYDMFVVEFED